MKAGREGLWLVVYMTHSRQIAEAVEKLLQGEGFLVRMQAHSHAGTYELCVLESEAQEARQLILEKGL